MLGVEEYSRSVARGDKGVRGKNMPFGNSSNEGKITIVNNGYSDATRL